MKRPCHSRISDSDWWEGNALVTTLRKIIIMKHDLRHCIGMSARRALTSLHHPICCTHSCELHSLAVDVTRIINPPPGGPDIKKKVRITAIRIAYVYSSVFFKFNWKLSIPDRLHSTICRYSRLLRQ